MLWGKAQRASTAMVVATLALALGACSEKKDPPAVTQPTGNSPASSVSTSASTSGVTAPQSPSVSSPPTTSPSPSSSPSSLATPSGGSPSSKSSTPGVEPTTSDKPGSVATDNDPGATPATGALKAELERAATDYYRALNRAYVTGDDSAVRALITPTCTCIKSVDVIARARERNLKIVAEYQIVKTLAFDLGANLGAVRLQYNLPSNQVVDATGNVVERYDSVENGLKDITLERLNGRWLISKIETYT